MTPEEKLLDLPKEQLDWFNSAYAFLNDDNIYTDSGDIDMLKNNICGYNDRFIGWKSDLMGLLDCFWMSYSSGGKSTKNTIYILDCCIMALEDAKELEYYEIAHNIKTVLLAITSNNIKNEQAINEYYERTKDNAANELF